jgi:thiosulfate/3-mercaptopyruvate sulfurtransferase
MTPLISVEELARLLASGHSGEASGGRGGVVPPGASSDTPTLLDVRWRLSGPPGMEAYQAGHVPAAVFIDLDRDLAGPPGQGGRHPMPSAAAFQAAMRRAGVSDDRLVVVYDDADSTAAARAWWLLCYFGHPRVRVLDGGYRAWTAAGQRSAISLPVTASAGVRRRFSRGRAAGTHAASVPPGDFTARPGHLPLLDAAEAAALARTGLLLDARSGERYRGETEPVDPVAGHIPGAVSAPTAENVNPDGTFRSRADLAARFAALGATPEPGGSAQGDGAGGSPAAPSVGVYCGSGVTAAHEVLAVRLAGIPAALYVGSWSEWITDPAHPVATGPA